MTRYHYLNGSILPEDQLRIPIADIAVGRGYGVFDYFQMREGVPFHMEAHVNRFFYSASELRLNMPLSRDDIMQGIQHVISKNHLTEAGIKLLATGGVSPEGFLPGTSNIAIIVLDYMKPNQEQEENGIALLSYFHQRELPHVKSTNYLLNVYLQPELRAAGALEPLYYNHNSVTETARANIFAIIDGVIITPASQMLKGINRQTVIEQLPYPVVERDISLEEMKNADEVFCTGTTKRAIAVKRIDDAWIGDGKPGTISMDIRRRLIQMEEQYISKGFPTVV